MVKIWYRFELENNISETYVLLPDDLSDEDIRKEAEEWAYYNGGSGFMCMRYKVEQKTPPEEWLDRKIEYFMRDVEFYQSLKKEIYGTR